MSDVKDPYCMACGRTFSTGSIGNRIKIYVEHFDKYNCHGIYPLGNIKRMWRKWKKIVSVVRGQEHNE